MDKRDIGFWIAATLISICWVGFMWIVIWNGGAR